MVQFYFLSIILLSIGSFVLLAADYGEKFSFIVRLRDLLFRNQTNTIVILVLTAVTGILKLISPMEPGPVVLGDFVPAVALIAVAIFYGFEMKSLGADMLNLDTGKGEDDEDDLIDSELVDKAEGFYYKNKRILGFLTAGIAFFHFLFPGAVLL